uniref:Uncharacterized protein n=1 Tax=Rhizophora mucronata TaxID=61149 RepID=A0A2P2NBW5_RHIMU
MCQSADLSLDLY